MFLKLLALFILVLTFFYSFIYGYKFHYEVGWHASVIMAMICSATLMRVYKEMYDIMVKGDYNG